MTTAAHSAAERKSVIDGLRALADYLEQHPDLPTPDVEACVIGSDGYDVEAPVDDQLVELARIAEILEVQPRHGRGRVYAEREFSDPPAPYRPRVRYKTWVTEPWIEAEYDARQSYRNNIQTQPEEIPS